MPSLRLNSYTHQYSKHLSELKLLTMSLSKILAQSSGPTRILRRPTPNIRCFSIKEAATNIAKEMTKYLSKVTRETLVTEFYLSKPGGLSRIVEARGNLGVGHYSKVSRDASH